MNNYRRGAAIEYRATKEFKQMGFLAQRTAGSHSPFDIIVIGKKNVLLVQCKLLNKATESRIKAVEREFEREWTEIQHPPNTIPILLIYEFGKGWLQSPQSLIKEGGYE